MSQHIITIVPVVDDDFTGSPIHTIVRLEITDGQATVRELIVRAPEGESIAWSDLPEVDFGLLVRAVNPGHRRPLAAAPATVAAVTPASTGAGPRRGAAPAKTAGVSRRTKQASPTLGHVRAGRAYRRAPDEEALEEAYRRAGTIAGVAEAFGVPVHTAQGWISRLRRRNVELSAE